MKTENLEALYKKMKSKKLDSDDAIRYLRGEESALLDISYPPIDAVPEEAVIPRDSIRSYSYDEPYLRDHLVDGERVLIGATYVSVAIDHYFREYPEAESLVIKRLSFVQPVQLASTEYAEIRVSFSPSKQQIHDKNNEFSIESCIKSAEGENGIGNGSDGWSEKAHGKYAPNTESKYLKSHEKISLGSIKSLLIKNTQLENLYNVTELVSIGDSFKNITELYSKPGKALVKVDLKSTDNALDHKYLLHPHIVNSAFLAMPSILTERNETDGYLPFAIKEIEINRYYQPLDCCWLYIRLNKKNEELILFDVEILSEDSTCIAHLSGCSVKRVRSTYSIGDTQIDNKKTPEGEFNEGENMTSRLDNQVSTAGAIDYILDKLESVSEGKVKASLDTNFMDMGMESSQLVALTDKIESETGIELYPTLFFEYPNVRSLAEYFVQEHEDVFQGLMKKHEIEKKGSSHARIDNLRVNSKKQESLKSNHKKVVSIDKSSSIVKSYDLKEKIQCADIAVIGMHGTFAESENIQQFWQNLVSKKNLIKEVPLDHWDVAPWFSEDMTAEDMTYCKWGSFINNVDKFDARFFNISPREAGWLDPQIRLLLQSVYATAEDAGYAGRIRGTDTGVFVGACFHDYSDRIAELDGPIDPYIGTGNSQTVIANRISFNFDLRGPSIAIDTACSSSLFALHAACTALRNDECSMAFVGGVNLLLSSQHYRYFSSIGALSPTGRSHSFDKAADGYVPGEAIASVLLKPLEQAIADGDRVYALIKGSAALHGGYTPSLTAPSVTGEQNVIVKAWKNAGIDPESISYIEAHGTGTKLGDPIEIQGLKNAFKEFTDKQNFCTVGSAKSNVGHTEGAAGLVGVLKVILQMKHKTIPGLAEFTEANPYLKLENSALRLGINNQPWENSANTPLRAGVSSFGFAGAYAHVVIEDFEQEKLTSQNIVEGEVYIIILSAKNRTALITRVEQLQEFIAIDLENHERQKLLDLSYTLQVGREELTERLAIVCDSFEDLCCKLQEILASNLNEMIIPGLIYRSSDDAQRERVHPIDGAALSNLSLVEIANLWVDKVFSGWSKLYQFHPALENIRANIISLPTYPFAKKRYWLPQDRMVKAKKAVSAEKSGKEFLSETLDKAESYADDKKNGNIILPSIDELTVVSLNISEEGVALVKVEDRDNVNQLTVAVITELAAVFEEIKKDTDIKVVVLTGYPEIFCMGGSKEVLLGISKEEFTYADEPFVFRGLLECPVPVISAMQGHAFGGGLVLGIQADMTFLSEKSLYSSNFMKYGFTPGMGGTLYLPEKLGRQLANYLMYSADILSGEELKALGIPVEVVKHEHVLAEALKRAKVLAAKSGKSLRLLKKHLAQDLLDRIPGIVEKELSMHQVTITSPEVRENITKLIDKIEKLSSGKKATSAAGGKTSSMSVMHDTIPTKKLSSKAPGMEASNLNKSGKDGIDINENLYAEDKVGSTAFSMTEAQAQKKIQKIISEKLFLDESDIGIGDVFSEMGIDSIAAVEIMREINQAFNVELESVVVYDYPSIHALAKYLVKNAENTIDNFESVAVATEPQKNEYFEPNFFSETFDLKEESHNKSFNYVQAGVGVVQDRIRKIIAEKLSFEIDEIGVDDVFNEMGVDSISAVEIIRDINKEFTVNIESVVAYDYPSIRAMSQYLVKEMSKGAYIADNFELAHQVSSGTSPLIDESLPAENLGQMANLDGMPGFSADKQSSKELIKDKSEFLSERKIQQEVKEIVRNKLYLEEDDIGIDDVFSEMGVDSISAVEIMREISQRYGIQLESVIAYDYPNIRALSSYLAQGVIGISGENSEKKRNSFSSELIKSHEIRKLEDQPGYVDLPKIVKKAPIAKPSGIKLSELPDIFEVNRRSDYAEISPVHAREQKVASIEEAATEESFFEKNRNKKNEMEIAVIGVSGRFPGARNINEFWDNLAQGINSVSDVNRDSWGDFYSSNKSERNKSYCKVAGLIEDFDKFDPLFFKISPSEAEYMDPQQRLFLEEAYHAFEDAGYTAKALSGSRCGVFVGAARSDYSSCLMENGAELNAYTVMGGSNSILAARISYLFNLKGPNFSIDTACSSSLVALHQACQSIQSGESSMALAGGVCVLATPEMHIMTSKANMLSEQGRCATFDQSADGFVPAEGVGAIILKPLEQAIADKDNIYGVIRGSGVNHDGATNGITAPSAESQKKLLTATYEKYAINPASINFIECHGTGTKLGDPIETRALRHVFESYTPEKQFCALGSVKSNIGHGMASAGIAGVIKVLLSLKHKKIPPCLHYKNANEHIPFEYSPFYVGASLNAWPVGSEGVRRAAVSSFGFSGTNAHVVIEEFEKEKYFSCGKFMAREFIVPLSAKTERQLHQVAQLLSDYIDDCDSEILIENLAYTLQRGRADFEYRIAFIAKDILELRSTLKGYIEGRKSDQCYAGEVHKQFGLLHFLSEREAVEPITTLFRAWLEDVNKGVEYLAKLWCKGLEVEWEALYEKMPTRITLPLYPFEKEHCWFNKNQDNSFLKTTVNFLPSPLLHKKLPSESGSCFSSIFSAHDYFFSDHKIQKRLIFPGAAYLEMVVQAQLQALDPGLHHAKKLKSSIVSIRDVNWKLPLIVTSDGMVRLDLTLEEINKEVVKGSRKFKFFSESSGEGRPHCTGSVDIDRKDVLQNIGTFPKDEVVKLCNKNNLTGVEYYEHFLALGIDYGTGHRGIDSIRVGANVALAELSLPEMHKANLEDYVLHPCMLDSALQCCAALLAEGGWINSIALPFSVGLIRVYGQCTEKMWVHVVRDVSFSQSQEQIASSEKFNINIYDIEGQIRIQIKEFLLKKIESPRNKISEDKSDSELMLFQPYWSEENIDKKDFDLVGKERVFDVHNIALCESLGRHEIIPGKQKDIFYLKRKGNPNSVENPDEGISIVEGYALQIFQKIKALNHKADEGKTALLQVLISGDDESGFNRILQGLSGLLKTAQIENRKLATQLIVIRDKDTDINQIVAENYYSQDQVVSYLNGIRNVQRWQRISNASNDEHCDSFESRKWRNGGVYLLAGGVGEIGLKFADEISRNSRGAIIILTGQQATDVSQLSLNKRQQIDRIAAHGAELHYRQLDLTKRDEVERNISEIAEKHGDINGILLCAGRIQDNPISKKSDAEFLGVLSVKLRAALYLDHACRHHDLDVFILFSSIAGAMGNSAQADYATANALLDNFSYLRNSWVKNGLRKGRTLSVNWPYWMGGGMRLNNEILSLMEKNTGMKALDDITGIRALSKIISSGVDHAMVIYGHQEKIVSMLGDRFGGSKKIKAEVDVEVQSDNWIIYTLKNDLRAVVSEQMKINIARIDEQKPLTHYGFDSISLAGLADKLNQKYKLNNNGTTAIPTVFFENPSIESVAQYLIKEYPSEISNKFSHNNENNENNENKKSDLNIDLDNSLERAHLIFEGKDDFTNNGERSDDLAIVGIHGVFPKANTLDEFWKNIIQAKSCIDYIPPERWSWEDYYGDPLSEDGRSMGNKTRIKWGGFIDGVMDFDPLFFGISKTEAEAMDPQQRLMLMSVWNTIEDAGMNLDTLQHRKTGVYIAATPSEYAHAEGLTYGNPYAITGMAPSIIANRISYFFDLEGPSEYCDTACSSSLVALHRAAIAIRSGECSQAIVGGINLMLSPQRFIGVDALGYLSPQGRAQSFGQGADGYVRSEGVGSMLIKPLVLARAEGDPIHAIIKGSGVCHGGRGLSLTAPNIAGMKDAIKQAFDIAKIDPGSIAYIEAQGIASPIGDAIEIAALSSGYRDEKTRFKGDNEAGVDEIHQISTLKQVIGHGEIVSGMAALFKVIYALKNKVIPGLANFETLHESISLAGSGLNISSSNREWLPAIRPDGGSLLRRASLNSYGFGGVNAHIILEEADSYSEKKEDNLESGKKLFVLSAKSIYSLNKMLEQIYNFIAMEKAPDLRNILHTLQVGREHMCCRLAIVCSDKLGLLRDIQAFMKLGCEDRQAQNNIFYCDTEELETATSDLFSNEFTKSMIYSAESEQDIERLAFYWSRGSELDWINSTVASNGRKVHVPGYIFSNEQYGRFRDLKISFRHHDNALDSPPPDKSDFSFTQHIRSLLSEEIGLPYEKLKLNRPFSDYGVDSIMAMKLIRNLRNKFDIDISGRVLFEHQTVSQLGTYLDNSYPGRLVSQKFEDENVEINKDANEMVNLSSTLSAALAEFKKGNLKVEDIRTLVESKV